MILVTNGSIHFVRVITPCYFTCGLEGTWANLNMHWYCHAMDAPQKLVIRTIYGIFLAIGDPQNMYGYHICMVF